MCHSDSGPIQIQDSPERESLCEIIKPLGAPEEKKATKGGSRSADIKGAIS